MLNGRKETMLLLIGDAVCFYIALFVALFLRYQEIPGGKLLSIHLEPFSILFAVWLLVFFIAGLYEHQTTLLKRRLPSLILNAQLANSLVAVLFFYFIPTFQIAPKTNLFLDLVLSFVLIFFWRQRSGFIFRARSRDNALLIGSGKELLELQAEINNNDAYGLHFIASIDLDSLENSEIVSKILQSVEENKPTAIVADFSNDKLEPLLPELYNLLFANVQLIDMQSIYEDLFLRVPLSLVGHSWFLENISTAPKRVYDALKRIVDIIAAIILFIISLPFDLFAIIAIKLDDGGPIFIVQDRIGKNDKIIQTYKFRSMTRNETDLSHGEGNKITRIGQFLRKTRIDEFPQFWNVIKGDLSLVGPRPELPSGVKIYESKVPYYRVRHLIKPGLSGWAQIYHENHPHHGEAVEETKEKLSYDLYYIKNRSFVLDLKIMLRTAQTLLSRTGR
jgi:exopolysaccharide biosynthesis polyprenyl glycosylphosphotransferase